MNKYIDTHMWGEGHRLVQVPVSPLLAETVIQWMKLTRPSMEDDEALEIGLWFLTAASLKHPCIALTTIAQWTAYMTAEAIEDKAIRRFFIEGHVAGQMRDLLLDLEQHGYKPPAP